MPSRKPGRAGPTNAGMQIAKPLVDTSVGKEWDRGHWLPIYALYSLGAKLAHPLLKVHGGAIVNVSSVHAIQTSVNISAYAASKGGLLALTRALAIEFGLITSGLMPSYRAQWILPCCGRSRPRTRPVRRTCRNGSITWRAKTVNGRVGTTAEIAHAIYFLAEKFVEETWKVTHEHQRHDRGRSSSGWAHLRLGAGTLFTLDEGAFPRGARSVRVLYEKG